MCIGFTVDEAESSLTIKNSVAVKKLMQNRY